MRVSSELLASACGWGSRYEMIQWRISNTAAGGRGSGLGVIVILLLTSRRWWWVWRKRKKGKEAAEYYRSVFSGGDYRSQSRRQKTFITHPSRAKTLASSMKDVSGRRRGLQRGRAELAKAEARHIKRRGRYASNAVPCYRRAVVWQTSPRAFLATELTCFLH